MVAWIEGHPDQILVIQTFLSLREVRLAVNIVEVRMLYLQRVCLQQAAQVLEVQVTSALKRNKLVRMVGLFGA